MNWQPIETAPKVVGATILATWDSTWGQGAQHIESCELGDEGRWFFSYDGD